MGFIFNHVDVGACYVCLMCVVSMEVRGTGSFEAEVTGNCEPPDMGWESNLVPEVEQYVF